MAEDYKKQNMRLIGIDYLKVFGIYLMVLGHSPMLPETIKTIIYSFHMPLFFFISGLFVKNIGIKKLLNNSIKSLLIPYILINLICLLLWIITHFIHGELYWSDFLSRLIAVTLGLGYERFGLVPICSPTWFFLALFWCRLFIYVYITFSNKIHRKCIHILSVMLIVYLMKKCNIIIPYAFSSALLAIPIMIFAYEFRDFILFRKISKKTIIMLVFFLTISFISFLINYTQGRCDIDAMWYGRSLTLFYINSISTCLILVTLFMHLVYQSKIVTNIANGTILIVGFHLTFAYYLYKLVEVVNFPKLPFAILVSFVILIICYPLILICKNFFPSLIGKYKRES